MLQFESRTPLSVSTEAMTPDQMTSGTEAIMVKIGMYVDT